VLGELNVELLNRLDRLIARHNLHGGAVTPVDLGRVVEAFTVGYRPFPPAVAALTMQWKSGDLEFARIAYNTSLREPSQAARKRHADAHEYAHIVCKHRGDLFVMWRAGDTPGAFAEYVDRCQEQQCERVAAYLLVPVSALRELAGMDTEYIAQVLEVPEHLVKLRWQIWRKFGR